MHNDNIFFSKFYPLRRTPLPCFRYSVLSAQAVSPFRERTNPGLQSPSFKFCSLIQDYPKLFTTLFGFFLGYCAPIDILNIVWSV